MCKKTNPKGHVLYPNATVVSFASASDFVSIVFGGLQRDNGVQAFFSRVNI